MLITGFCNYSRKTPSDDKIKFGEEFTKSWSGDHQQKYSSKTNNPSFSIFQNNVSIVMFFVFSRLETYENSGFDKKSIAFIKFAIITLATSKPI